MKIKAFLEKALMCVSCTFLAPKNIHFPKGFFKKWPQKIFHPFFIGLLHVFKPFFTKPLIWTKKRGPSECCLFSFAYSASEVWAALRGKQPRLCLLRRPLRELPLRGCTSVPAPAFLFFPSVPFFPFLCVSFPSLLFSFSLFCFLFLSLLLFLACSLMLPPFVFRVILYSDLSYYNSLFYCICIVLCIACY